jgi:hypothetical protein
LFDQGAKYSSDAIAIGEKEEDCMTEPKPLDAEDRSNFYTRQLKFKVFAGKKK